MLPRYLPSGLPPEPIARQHRIPDPLPWFDCPKHGVVEVQCMNVLAIHVGHLLEGRKPGALVHFSVIDSDSHMVIVLGQGHALSPSFRFETLSRSDLVPLPDLPIRAPKRQGLIVKPLSSLVVRMQPVLAPMHHEIEERGIWGRHHEAPIEAALSFPNRDHRAKYSAVKDMVEVPKYDEIRVDEKYLVISRQVEDPRGRKRVPRHLPDIIVRIW
mmetsp:Transcript_96918/g.211900  ORF Transcript_96918/g.211900 Transcript_96918/m.211900 type:complete len:214 (+) Transcript_96918:729-1370(+)